MTPGFPPYRSIEEQLLARLGTTFSDIELEPVAENSTATVTFSFATTGRVNRLQRIGVLTLHFYDITPLAAFNRSYETEMLIEAEVSASQGMYYTITSAALETRTPISDEETGEFINVECTYNIGYTIRRA